MYATLTLSGLGFPSAHSTPLGPALSLPATPENFRPPVWPHPLSLATTYGISFDFSSWGYLDVSVRPVSLRIPMYSIYGT